MAITLPAETGTITSERRTWRTEIESPKGAVPIVTAHRQVVRTFGGETISMVPAERVERNVGDVIAQTVTLASGKVISVADIAEALPMFIDNWEAENIASREQAALVDEGR